MGDRAWAKFQAQMKHKHVQKKSKADAGSAGIIHQGAREFVPFTEYEDLTLANIKHACW